MNGWLGCLGVLIAGLVYWELVLAEGAHLGPSVVVGLYDQVAARYEAIKRFDPEMETSLLGAPLAAELAGVASPRILDVAAGTGRLSRAVLRQPDFDGRCINADLSRSMLQRGRQTGSAELARTRWLQAPADRLPFADHTFDAVTCLEALEFLSSGQQALAELIRVLKPGGVLVTTNRVGGLAWLMPGKTRSRASFRRLLQGCPLDGILVYPWQVDYDLAWARRRSASV